MRERLMCGAVFAASLLLYLSFRSLYFNFDGVACAIAVELSDFKHLVHGNHLAYGVLAWVFDRAWRLAGYRGAALLDLQVLDGVLGAVGAAVFASLLRRLGRSEREAALGGLALAVSHAWWFWSLEAQVYMLGALFAALAAREALASEPRPALVGLWSAGAVLGHVGHAMALPALVWMMSRKKGRRSIVPLLAAFTVVAIAAYAAAGVWAVEPRSAEDLRRWLLGSAALKVDRSFSWHWAPPWKALSDWLRLTPQVFCALPVGAVAARAAGVALACAPLLAAVRGATRRDPESRFFLLWLAGYAALYLTWEPFTLVYRISDLIGLWALALIGLQDLRAGARLALLATWTAAAGAFNLIYAVRPAADPANNADLAETLWTEARAPRDAWMIADGRTAVYFPYFAHLKTVNLRYFGDESALNARLDALNAAGQGVYATSRTLEQSGIADRFARYGLTPVASGDGLTLYRVRKAVQ